MEKNCYEYNYKIRLYLVKFSGNSFWDKNNTTNFNKIRQTLIKY